MHRDRCAVRRHRRREFAAGTEAESEACFPEKKCESDRDDDPGKRHDDVDAEVRDWLIEGVVLLQLAVDETGQSLREQNDRGAGDDLVRGEAEGEESEKRADDRSSGDVWVDVELNPPASCSFAF